MSETPGQYIQIHWTHDYPDAEYVRGHVPHDEARAEIRAQVWEVPADAPVRHRWARYVPSQSEEYDMTIRLYDAPGTGCFPVTEVSYSWEG